MSEIICDCTKDAMRGTGGRCVLHELRQLSTAAGRAHAMADYNAQIRAAQGEQANAIDAADLPMRMQKAGVPADAILTLRGQVRDGPAIEAARKFVTAPGDMIRMLLLLGPVGAGKTVAAAHVVKEFCRRFPWNSQPTGGNLSPVIFIEASRLTRLSSFASVDTDWLAALNRAQLLVLDDAGDEGTQIGRDEVARLLLGRYEKGRRTVVTGNLTVDALESRYGKAIRDRIRTGGIAPDLWGQKSMRTRAA